MADKRQAAADGAAVWVVAHGMVDDRPRGSVVSREDLGLDAAQWQRLVDLGAVERQRPDDAGDDAAGGE